MIQLLVLVYLTVIATTVATTIPLATTVATTILPRSYWRFEDPTAFGTDTSGRNNLTLPDVPTPPYSVQNTTGIVGSYLSLQGSNTSLSVGAMFLILSAESLHGTAP